MKWALVVATGEKAHRSPIGADLARALVARGLRVRRLAPFPSGSGGPRLADPGTESADALVLEFIQSLEPAGEEQRATFEEASGRARLVVLVFRHDQLIAGVERLGLGAPVATHIEGEASTVRDAFLEVAAAVAAGRVPPGPPEPLRARMTDDARRIFARRNVRIVTLSAVFSIVWTWSFTLAAEPTPVVGWRTFSWIVTACAVTIAGVVLATGGVGLRPVEFTLQGDDLLEEVEWSPPRVLGFLRRSPIPRVQVRRGAVSSIRERRDGLSLRGLGVSVFIPRGVERYGDVREALARWRRMERHRIPLPHASWLLIVLMPLSTSREILAIPWARVAVLVVTVALAGLLVAASIVNENIPRWRRWGQRAAAALLLLFAARSHGDSSESGAMASVVHGHRNIRIVLGEHATMEELDRTLRSLGAQPAGPLGPETGAAAPVPAAKGRAWLADTRLVERIVVGSVRPLREHGITIVRVADAPVERGKAVLAAFATADLREVVRAVGTCSPRHRLETAQVVAWLDALAGIASFELTAVGTRSIEGWLTDRPENVEPIARLVVGLTPDVGPEAVPALAEDLARTGRFALVWDGSAGAP